MPNEKQGLDISNINLNIPIANPNNPTPEEMSRIGNIELEKKNKELAAKKYKAQYDIAKSEIESSLATDKDLYFAGDELKNKVNSNIATESEKAMYEELKPKYESQQQDIDSKMVHWGLNKISKNADDPKLHDLATKYINALHSEDPTEKSKAFDYLSNIKKINPNWQPNENLLNPIENQKLKEVYKQSVINYKVAENEYNNAKAKLGGDFAQLAANIPLLNASAIPLAAKFKEKEAQLRDASIKLEGAYKSYVLKEDLSKEQRAAANDNMTSANPLDATLNLLKGFGNWSTTELNTLASHIKGVSENEDKIANPTYTTNPIIEQTEQLKNAYRDIGEQAPKNIEETQTPFTTELGRSTGGLTYMMGQTLPIAPLMELSATAALSGGLGVEVAELSNLSKELVKSNKFLDRLRGTAINAAITAPREGLTFSTATGDPEQFKTGVEFGLAGSLGEIMPKIISQTPYLNKLAGATATVSGLEAKKYVSSAIDYIANDEDFDKALEKNGVDPNMPIDAKKALIDIVTFWGAGMMHGAGGNKEEAQKEYNRLSNKFKQYSSEWVKSGMDESEVESIGNSIEETKPTEAKIEETITPTGQKVEVKAEQPDLKTALAELETEDKPTTPQVNEGVETPLNEPINEVVAEQPKVEIVNESTIPKLDEVVGKQLKYRGQEGTIVKDEGGKFEFHTPNMIIELGNENVPISDWGMKVTEKEEIPHNISLQDENNVTINGNKYTINVDEKGNVASISPQNKPEQQIKNEKLITQVEIERNKLEHNPKELSIIAETPKEQYDNATKNINEQKVLEGVYLKNMTETISSAMDKLDSGEKLDEKEKIQTEQWVFDALDSVEKLMEENPNNPHYEQAHKTLQTINELLNESRSNDSETTIPQPTEKPQRRSAKKPTSIQGNESGSAKKQSERSAAPESVGEKTKGSESGVAQNAVRQTLSDALKETEGLREASKKKARNKLIDKHFENIFAQLTLKEPNKIKRIC
jgi:hypothetical protein